MEKQSPFIQISTYYIISILLICSPFIYIPDLFEFANLPQTVFVQTVIIVLVTIRLLTYLRNKSDLYFPLTALTVILIGYCVWIWLSLLWAHNRYEGFIFNSHMSVCALTMFITAAIPVSNEWRKRWMLSLMLGCSGVVIIGFLQYWGVIEWIRQVESPAATFGNKNMAAQFVCMVLVLLPGLFFCFQKRCPRILIGLSGSMALMFLFFTKSRAGWLATSVSLLISLALLYRDAQKPDSLVTFSRAVIIKIAIGICGTVLIIACFHPSTVKRMYSGTMRIFVHPDYANGESTISIRLKIWRNSFEMVKDRPIAGYGAGNFKVFYPLYHQKAVTDTVFSPRQHPKYVHNDFVQHAVEFGVIGAILFVGFFCYTLLLAYRLLRSNLPPKSRMLTISVCCGIVCFMVLSMFSFPSARALPPLLLFLYSGILMNIYLHEKRPAFRYTIKIRPMIKVFGCAVVVVFGVFLTRFNVHNLISDKYYNFAQQMENLKNWNGAIDYGLRAHHHNPFNAEIRSTIGLAYAQTGQLAEAISMLEKASAAFPYHMNSLLNLGAAYTHLGDYESALATLERVRGVKPDHVNILTDLGMLYAKTNRLVKAIECFQGAVSRAPSNPIIHAKLGTVFFKKKMYADAAREYEVALTIDPTLTQAHKNLGLLYYNQLKQYNKALYHMHKYVMAHPSDNIVKEFREILDAFENG